MRTSRAVLTTSLLATVVLAGCTSDPGDTQATETTDDGIEGSIPDNGWWCRMFDEEVVATATEGRTDLAREVLRKNDEEGWQCEVVLPVDGGPETEAVLTLTIAVNDEEAAETLRADAGAADADLGPDYLGESYVYPGTVVAIVPCGGPVGTPLAGSRVPYAVSVVAHSQAGRQMTDELVPPARRTVVDLDMTTGCYPKLADRPDGEGGDGSTATEAPQQG
jgi:hypothetical protein